MNSEIAVCDVETTGLFPKGHDRIVEIAVIRMTADGNVVDEFVSLVNPERDIGPTSIHGLDSSDVLQAPTFRELAGEIAARFHGTVAIAGHNVKFDQGFLRSEFERAEVQAPEWPSICTMRLFGGGKLHECCEDYGIEFDGRQHSALADARATAGLMSYLLGGDFNTTDLRAMPQISWPQLLMCSKSPVTRQVARERQQTNSYLQRLMLSPIISATSSHRTIRPHRGRIQPGGRHVVAWGDNPWNTSTPIIKSPGWGDTWHFQSGSDIRATMQPRDTNPRVAPSGALQFVRCQPGIDIPGYDVPPSGLRQAPGGAGGCFLLHEPCRFIIGASRPKHWHSQWHPRMCRLCRVGLA